MTMSCVVEKDFHYLSMITTVPSTKIMKKQNTFMLQNVFIKLHFKLQKSKTESFRQQQAFAVCFTPAVTLVSPGKITP